MSFSELKQPDAVPVKLWASLEEVESSALDQLKAIARLPRVYHHVAAMPDVHAGIGCTVGSVVAMKDALAPAFVGVDIGCGMAALRTNLLAKDLPDSLEETRSDIESAIPVGKAAHDASVGFSRINGAQLWKDVYNLMGAYINEDLVNRARRQCGTLGGGNHFIELCLDEQDRVWIMLHSGSRNIGKTLAEYHMDLATRLDHNASLSDPDLATFLAGTHQLEAYRNDLNWAQEYAALNRRTILYLIRCVLAGRFKGIKFFDNEMVLCHHNYVAEEVHFGEKVYVTRKGAIRAQSGDLGIIPGSMGAASFIVRGLGNPESFCSAAHGAGRKMSRGAAKRAFTVEDLAQQTHGVCCRKDAGVIDEIPGAYKDIDKVMANQVDLVQIVHKLKQVMCIKG